MNIQIGLRTYRVDTEAELIAFCEWATAQAWYPGTLGTHYAGRRIA